jgi:hypothetical protein
MRTRILLLSFLLALAAFSARIGNAGDAEVLLRGVASATQVGLPGPLCLVDPSAFPVFVGMENGVGRVIAAGGTFGRGRYLVFGHGGYPVHESADIQALMRNALPWLAGKQDRIVVGTYRVDGFKTTGEGITIRQLNESDLRRLHHIDVLYFSAHANDTAMDIDRIQRFVQNGGGLIVAGTGWGWAQLSGNNNPADFPENRLMGPMGVYWSLQTQGNPVLATSLSDATRQLCNASKAFAALASGQPLDQDAAAQIGATLMLAINTLPSSDTILLPKIRNYFAARPEIGAISVDQACKAGGCG